MNGPTWHSSGTDSFYHPSKMKHHLQICQCGPYSLRYDFCVKVGKGRKASCFIYNMFSHEFVMCIFSRFILIFLEVKLANARPPPQPS